MRELQWDGETLGEWSSKIDGARAVVNLTGRTIVCRRTKANRKQILNSRLNSVVVLHEAIVAAASPPPVWIQASAIGYYGETGDAVADEFAPPGSGFLADVVRRWEEVFFDPEVSTRRVALRIGLVLGSDGGAFPELRMITKLFMGGSAGSGRQYISWIHVSDLVGMILWSIETSSVSGIYNAVSPESVTNKVFMEELRRGFGRPWSPPVPTPLIRLGAWLRGASGDLIIRGHRVSSG